MMKNSILIDIVGWIGAVALLLAYALVSTRKIGGDKEAYQLLNLSGAFFLMINSFFYGAYPSAGVNIVWIGIGVYALMRRRGSYSQR